MENKKNVKLTTSPQQPGVLESRLETIKHLLSHLHEEITDLEQGQERLLGVLRTMEKRFDVNERDELSGLLQRRPFFREWEELLKQCAAAQEEAGFIIIDIDHFKKINDQFGHPTGDEVIHAVGKLIHEFELAQNAESGKVKAVSGRYGGEEFVIGLQATESECLLLADRIRTLAASLSGPVLEADGNQSSTKNWSCTLSAGVAHSSNLGLEPKKLLSSADEALYDAKHSGRNRVKAA